MYAETEQGSYREGSICTGSHKHTHDLTLLGHAENAMHHRLNIDNLSPMTSILADIFIICNICQMLWLDD